MAVTGIVSCYQGAGGGVYPQILAMDTQVL